VLGCGGNCVRIVDSRVGRCIATVEVGDSDLKSIDISEDMTSYLCGNDNGWIYEMDLRRPEKIYSRKETDGISKIMYGVDGGLVHSTRKKIMVLEKDRHLLTCRDAGYRINDFDLDRSTTGTVVFLGGENEKMDVYRLDIGENPRFPRWLEKMRINVDDERDN
jgi:WD40 repeat protein